MKTVVSKTGIEVLYPCTIHVLTNEAIIECEYKSDNIGQDLMDYICDYFSLKEIDYWGLKFIDTYGQRHWLDVNKLIRTQVKNCCPVHFQLRIKVYPPQPYKLSDQSAKDQIFIQLRFALISGSLSCGPNDVPLFVSLILQYIYGDYDENVHFGNYVKEKIIINQTFTAELKAIEIHKNYLKGLNEEQAIDLFLRLACQLETYGVDPYLVENDKNEKLILYINYKGIATYKDSERVNFYDWMTISKITQSKRLIYIHLTSNKVITYVCVTEGECNYIYLGALSHLIFFTTSGYQSTVGIIGDKKEDDTSTEVVMKYKSDPKEDLFRINRNRNKLSKFRKIYNFFICRHTILFIVFVSVCFLVHVLELFQYNILEISERIKLLRWSFD